MGKQLRQIFEHSHVATSLDYKDLSLDDPMFGDWQLPESLTKAVPKRQIEFMAGRLCAHHSLKTLGYAGTKYLQTGEHRQPIWPDGFVGAISHSHGAAIAIAGHSSEWAGMGVDIEHFIESPSEGLIKQICSLTESEQLNSLNGYTKGEVLTFIFSAKESLYKALFPRVGRFFGFGAAEVSLDLPQNSGVIRIVEDLAPFKKDEFFTVNFVTKSNYCISKILIDTYAK
ncbi:MAG: 4'-phosphopantetheinyl transferase superfamily protein [Pseudobacteriovorax sp.]|nr:4'-phosphopantetheinyl transferase superfamily protein [Pseudobacteriovorax sp.]